VVVEGVWGVWESLRVSSLFEVGREEGGGWQSAPGTSESLEVRYSDCAWRNGWVGVIGGCY